jgi:hypothetical protein
VNFYFILKVTKCEIFYFSLNFAKVHNISIAPLMLALLIYEFRKYMIRYSMNLLSFKKFDVVQMNITINALNVLFNKCAELYEMYANSSANSNAKSLHI